MVAKHGIVVYDGMKAVSPYDFDNDRGWTPITGDEKLTGEALYFARVPWLYRGVVDRANMVGRMPWFVMQGETDIDDAANWQNALRFMPAPRRLMALLEQSLAMTGRAYLFKETNRNGYIKSLVYCKPSSIEEIKDPRTGEITGYKRRLGSQTLELGLSDIVAIYLPDYLTEAGPGKTSPAMAALMAAGVMYNAQGFIASYFKRGAIKATVLTANNTSEPEAERLQNWWEDVVQGIKNAWSAVVLRGEAIKATVIGEGVQDLQNETLTTAQRQEISVALGVPESRLWSSAANYATREMDEKSYYESTIIPECQIIAEAFNMQVFTKAHNLEGYKIEARYETMDVFQVDNREQADAYAAYISAGMLPSVAAQVLGVELPEGMNYEDLDKPLLEKQRMEAEAAAAAREQMQNSTSQDDSPDEDDDEEERKPTPQEVRSVLRAWRNKSLARLKETGKPDCDFETSIIPAAQQAAIRAALAVATCPEEVKAAMDAQPPDALAELKRANDLLERYGGLVNA